MKNIILLTLLMSVGCTKTDRDVFTDCGCGRIIQINYNNSRLIVKDNCNTVDTLNYPETIEHPYINNQVGDYICDYE